MKTKIKSHGDGVTDFYDKKVPKVDSNHTLAVISFSQDRWQLLSPSVFKRV